MLFLYFDKVEKYAKILNAYQCAGNAGIEEGNPAAYHHRPATKIENTTPKKKIRKKHKRLRPSSLQPSLWSFAIISPQHQKKKLKYTVPHGIASKKKVCSTPKKLLPPMFSPEDNLSKVRLPFLSHRPKSTWIVPIVVLWYYEEKKKLIWKEEKIAWLDQL